MTYFYLMSSMLVELGSIFSTLVACLQLSGCGWLPCVCAALLVAHFRRYNLARGVLLRRALRQGAVAGSLPRLGVVEWPVACRALCLSARLAYECAPRV